MRAVCRHIFSMTMWLSSRSWALSQSSWCDLVQWDLPLHHVCVCEDLSRMVHGWSRHLVCASIFSWILNYVDFTMLKVSQCQRMAGQMTFCAGMVWKVFHPQATAWNTSGSHIYSFMMVMDLMIPWVIELAWKHNIILFCLPPHTTHKLQPLMLVYLCIWSLFTQLDRTVRWDCWGYCRRMLREDFVKEYMDVRRTTFKLSTIHAAWQKSGCWPVNLLSSRMMTLLQVSPLQHQLHMFLQVFPSSISYTRILRQWSRPVLGNNEQDDLLLSSDSENSLESGDDEDRSQMVQALVGLLRKPPP